MRKRERAAKVARLALHQVERARAGSDRILRKGAMALSGMTPMQREAAHWSRRKSAVVTWQDHPLIRKHINARVSGDPDENWLDYFADNYARKAFKSALNLGCGHGDLEEHAFHRGLAERFTSVDVSGDALERVRQRLPQYNLVLRREDVNYIELQSEQYDLVSAASSLHHFTRLEHLLDQVRGSLAPGGLLLFDEFVGPSRFQWTDMQLSIINRLLRALPQRLRKDLRRGCGTKRRVHKPPTDGTGRDSPFEAARSGEIMNLVQERFRVLERRDYGGAVLHQLLDGIAGNFNIHDSGDVRILNSIARLEIELERKGIIESDFTVVIAKKREE